MKTLKYIGCTIDKDLDQFPGWLYNLTTGDITYSNNFGYLIYSEDRKQLKGRGFLFFCAQMMMGDVADNILGIKNVGPKKSYSLLKDCKSFTEAWNVVYKLYAHNGISELELKANAQLLWITHEKGRRLPHDVTLEHLV